MITIRASEVEPDARRIITLLQQQTAIITGAGQGLGRAIALEFAREGASVALIDRNPATLEAVQAEIASQGGDVRLFVFDITDYQRYTEVVEAVIAWKGRIDTLVNNAGIALYGTILTDSLADWLTTLAVNLEALYMGSKLVAPHMIAQGGGRIIHISSIAGFVSRGNVGAYNASKGAIIAYTKSMAVELGQHNILVNAVAPGFMWTPMMVQNGVDETKTPAFEDWYIKRGKIPLRRTGYPEDVAGTVVFLASGYCRYMTGQVLVVDGGLTSTF